MKILVVSVDNTGDALTVREILDEQIAHKLA